MNANSGQEPSPISTTKPPSKQNLENAQRIGIFNAICRALQDIHGYDAYKIVVWWNTPNPYMLDATPMQLLHDNPQRLAYIMLNAALAEITEIVFYFVPGV